MRDDDDEVHDKFEQVVSTYGQMESVMGAEGYQAFIESRVAERDGIKAIGDRTTAHAHMIRVLTLIMFMAAIPIIVLLWKVALGW